MLLVKEGFNASKNDLICKYRKITRDGDNRSLCGQFFEIYSSERYDKLPKLIEEYFPSLKIRTNKLSKSVIEIKLKNGQSVEYDVRKNSIRGIYQSLEEEYQYFAKRYNENNRSIHEWYSNRMVEDGIAFSDVVALSDDGDINDIEYRKKKVKKFLKNNRYHDETPLWFMYLSEISKLFKNGVISEELIDELFRYKRHIEYRRTKC